jgi:hypothetical protein
VDKKCNCTDGYFGPHCEYHKQTATETITDDLYVFIPQVDQECNLTCKNGGQCLFGIKDYSDAFSEPLEKYLGTNLNGMNWYVLLVIFYTLFSFSSSHHPSMNNTYIVHAPKAGQDSCAKYP